MSIIRINQLPEGSGSLSEDDIFVFMDDPSGGGSTKKISLSQISNAIGSGESVSISAGSGITVNESSGNFTINSNLVSNPSGIAGASVIINIVQISQIDYDNLGSYDLNTIYIINT